MENVTQDQTRAQALPANFLAPEFFNALRRDYPKANIVTRMLKPKDAPASSWWKPLEFSDALPACEGDYTALTIDFARQHGRSAEEMGVYFVVNPAVTTTENIADDHITAFCAAFVENDRATITEQHAALDAAPLPTSARIETAKSVHAYWFLEPGATEEEWREIQLRLIAYFGGDPAIKNPSRIMRAPGFDHTRLDADGVTIVRKPVVCVQLDPERRYTAEEMLKAFPSVSAANGDAQGIPSLSGKSGYRLPDLIEDGVRNVELFKYGCSERAKGAEHSEIEEKLLEANATRCNPPKPDAEVSTIAAQASKYPKGDSQEMIEEQCTDIANAEGFVEMFGEQFCYVIEREALSVWSGKNWEIGGNADHEVKTLAIQYAKTRFDEAKSESDHAKRVRLSRHAVYTSSAKGIDNFLRLVPGIPGVAVGVHRFDADLDALNALNGTIDLSTGELRPHRREDYITKLAPVVYDPNATAPRWGRYLLEIFQGNKELVDYVWRMTGYTMTGRTREECFFLLYGNGRNGKGTMVETLYAILGDYADTVDPAILLQRNESGGNTPELAKLKGIRFAPASETDKRRKLAEAFIKRITGGDSITACHKYENPFTYKPSFKLWLATNQKPVITGTDLGIWSRVKMIPFLEKYEANDPRLDKTLKETLLAEMPGILAWAVRGAVAWYAHGLGSCKTVDDATKVYREDSNTVARFLKDRCVIGGDKYLFSSSALHMSYRLYCEGDGETFLDQKEFTGELVKLGYESKRKAAGVFWQGISLKLDEPESEADQTTTALTATPRAGTENVYDFPIPPIAVGVNQAKSV